VSRPRRFHTLYNIFRHSSRNQLFFHHPTALSANPQFPSTRPPTYSCAPKHELLSSREPTSIHLVTRCLSTDLLLYRPPLLV
jgi:hypothetical protein